MPFTDEEARLRREVRETFNFLPYCQSCAGDIHCCSRAGNVVVVRSVEREYLEAAHIRMATNDDCSDSHQLTFMPAGSGLFILKEDDGKCPLLKSDGTCAVHENKPLDCLLWPRMFASTSELPVLTDTHCPAIRSSQIPNVFYARVQALGQLLTVEQRRLYAELNIGSYGSGRLQELTSIDVEDGESHVLGADDHVNCSRSKNTAAQCSRSI